MMQGFGETEVDRLGSIRYYVLVFVRVRQRDAELDRRPSMDFYAVCKLAWNGDIDGMKAWLLRGGDANQVDIDGASLGWHTLLRGSRQSDMIRLLVSHGMDVNHHTPGSASHLHDCRCPEVAATLIELGADVNATSWDGETPLFEYVELNERHAPELIRLLLRHGCDVAVVNEDGDDVVAVARESYKCMLDHGQYGKDRMNRQLAIADFLADVKSAGSWKAYLRAPRVQLVRLRSLCDRGRAAPPSVASGNLKLTTLRTLSAAEIAIFARLFGAPTTRRPRGSSSRLPNEIFWHILSFWRTDRDGDD